MNVNMTEMFNSLADTKANLSNKEKFTAADFSNISEEFTNIFDKQFLSQFDYQNLFNTQEGASASFMSSAATSFTNDLSIEKDFKDAPSYTEKLNSESRNHIEENIYEAKSATESNLNQEVESKSLEQKQQDEEVANKHMKENAEQTSSSKETSKTEESKAEAAEGTTKDNVEESSEEVTLKAKVEINTEVKSDAKTEVKPELRAEVKSELKDKEVEIKVETNQLEKAEVKVAAEQQGKAEVEQKAVVQDNKAIQNRVSMERITANIDSEEVNTEEKAKVEKEDGKKTSEVLAKVAHAPQEAAKKQDAQSNNPNFQNQQQLPQQANQHAQDKAHVASNNVAFDTTLAKANGNQQTNSLFGKAMENPMPKQAMEKNVVDQVMKNIRGNISAKNSNITMILKPAELGKVTINILNQRGVMTTEIKAETQQAADALNKNIDDLKQTLKSQGVSFDNLVVKVENSNKSENNTQFSFEQQNLKDFEDGSASSSNKDASSQEASGTTDVGVKQEALAEETEEGKELLGQKENDKSGLVDYRV